MELIKNLQWRYATKKFDTSRKVSQNELEQIMEAVRLSASSYGLQAYKVLVVEDEAVREQLKAASWNQPQITDSSHLFVFCNYKQINDQVIDEFIALNAGVKGIGSESLQPYADFLKNSLTSRSEDDLQVWTSKQTYIALANLLTASAELKIDACPMEGFDAAAYNEILGLNEKGLSAAVVAAVGYRSADDETQFAAKVRKMKNELFEIV
ncbi:NAD(P)H-dependent oxidoreductase [Roseimarinus sediminis]|jgi:nitroreductase|uniref:NAD(P)H-dependent oxidoreductase n=1 Tax=Roseimarinus sediminis TaxID=1610899 RepID=UPI003D23EAC4